MILRQTKLSDYPRVATLLRTCGLVDDWFTRDLFKRILTRNRGFYFVVEDRGDIVGSAFGTTDGGCLGYIYKVAVAPTYRRRGLAQKLVSRILREFKRNKVDEWVFVHIAKKNQASIKLFNGLGFKIRKTHYLVDNFSQ